MKKQSAVMLGIVIAVLVIAAAVIWYVADQNEKAAQVGQGTTAKSRTAKAATGKAIVVGAVFDVTGTTGAPLGEPEKATAEMLVKEINANGGINGRPIDLRILDNASDPKQSASEVKKLIDEDKVIAVIGASQTGTTLSMVDAIKAAKIPLISCAAGNQIVNPVERYVFKTAQSDILAVQKLYDYLKANKLTDIAVITVSNPFGQSGLKQLKDQAKDAGITISDEEVFGPDDKDMQPQLIKIRKSTAKAVVCWGTNPGPAIIAKNMATLEMKQPLLMSHGIANQSFIKLAGDAANGVVFPAGKLLIVDSLPDSDKQKSVLLAYRDAYKKAYNKDADTFGGHAYDAVNLLKDALMKAGPDDPAKLRDAIESTKDFVGVSGIFNFSDKEHNGLTMDCFAMVTIKDGKWAPAD